jgi:hypothetical protein
MSFPKILLDGDERLSAFPEAAVASRMGRRVTIGWREWAGLPQLGIARIMAKIDTGARTSALHANSIEAFDQDGAAWVRFDVAGEAEGAPWHEAPISDRRLVRSSNGKAELRHVIRTELALAGRVWTIEVTLTNRERMDLPMLIGREALAGRVLVDAQKSWVAGRLPARGEGKASGSRKDREGTAR